MHHPWQTTEASYDDDDYGEYNNDHDDDDYGEYNDHDDDDHH